MEHAKPNSIDAFEEQAAEKPLGTAYVVPDLSRISHHYGLRIIAHKDILDEVRAAIEQHGAKVKGAVTQEASRAPRWPEAPSNDHGAVSLARNVSTSGPDPPHFDFAKVGKYDFSKLIEGRNSCQESSNCRN